MLWVVGTGCFSASTEDISLAIPRFQCHSILRVKISKKSCLFLSHASQDRLGGGKNETSLCKNGQHAANSN